MFRRETANGGGRKIFVRIDKFQTVAGSIACGFKIRKPILDIHILCVMAVLPGIGCKSARSQ
jgi:hypothetical protein